MNDKPMGTFHLLPPELQKTAIMASKENAKSNQKNFDAALERQFKKRRMKEEIILRKQYANATEEYVVTIYFMNSITHINVGRQWRKQKAHMPDSQVKQRGWGQ